MLRRPFTLITPPRRADSSWRRRVDRSPGEQHPHAVTAPPPPDCVETAARTPRVPSLGRRSDAGCGRKQQPAQTRFRAGREGKSATQPPAPPARRSLPWRPCYNGPGPVMGIEPLAWPRLRPRSQTLRPGPILGSRITPMEAATDTRTELEQLRAEIAELK